MSRYALQQSQIRSARQPVVMVVEDDILIRFPIAEHLRGLRFTVIEAGSGAEAIDLYGRLMTLSMSSLPMFKCPA